MDSRTDTIMIIGIPREYHDTLSKWAAERNLKNLPNTATVETMAVEAICEYIDRMEQLEANLKPTDEMAEAALKLSDHDPDDFSNIDGSLPSQKNAQE
jgi:hypothetical protein